ncbi:hypothetical protein [Plantactinospora sp. KLBMP9567]|uniref:hypothetical protein n=1 Tax=Plantactinospora sp. KLBMP9567 TaxID=3085900 RepID=UPI002981F820|nr:hypothetical protein [Plantactinospora sp. KLBMP9567]MDW5323930.1 hypothetical protein [Plantactinospora sp. KLBMP9567]
MPPLSDARLLQLAAAGSNGEADVNVQGQLYPVGMPAARALRLAAGGLIGQSLTVDELRKRVWSRFPRAEELPGRPRLDEVLAECEVPLVWLPTQRHYGRPESRMTVGGGTRMTNTVAPILGPDATAEAHAKLVGAIERRGFLVVKTSMRRLTAARRALLSRLGLTEVDVTAILLDRLRALGYPWDAIVAADNGSPADADFRSLVDLVRHEVVPAIGEALAAADGPALLTEAAPLARYGQMRVVQELADPTRPRPAARLLLLPVRRPEAALLDGEPIPLVSPASQALWLPDTWLTPPSLPTSRRGVHCRRIRDCERVRGAGRGGRVAAAVLRWRHRGN